MPPGQDPGTNVVPASPGDKKRGLMPIHTSPRSQCSVSTGGKAWERTDDHAITSRRGSVMLKQGTAVTLGGQAHVAPAKKPGLRQTLVHSAWYRSRRAEVIRTWLHGKAFAVMMVLALFLALFLPDIWVLAGMNSDDFSDIVLTIVMGLFTIELVLLSAVDALYFLSFFFVMDIIGTVSMCVDISYMLGTSATEAQTWDDLQGGSASFNYMLLRATRAAKVGARAGRLSRFLRILRFLPFMRGSALADAKKGMASAIMKQLANLVAVRVACLTIVLVMIVPLFDIWTFPSFDHSQDAWVSRLSSLLAKGRLQAMQEELQMMAQSYADGGIPEYGPYAACKGIKQDSGFICQEPITGWTPRISAPPRMRSALLVSSDVLQVAFNMHQTHQLEAGLNMGTICFIVFVMVFSGLALSSVVTELAVRPLERMLGIVRHIATTVFNLADKSGKDGDEDLDIEVSSEMKLLEKVVNKLSIIVALQTKEAVQNVESMQEEDIGILSMMQGKNVVEEAAKADRRQSVAVPRRRHSIPTIRLEDCGVTQDQYSSWSFNPLPITRSQRVAVAVFTVARFHEAPEGFVQTGEDNVTLQRFVAAAEKEYLANPFHNFAHAVDVVHGVARMLRLTESEGFLSELEQFALLIAAIAHDLGHPGVNNGFLSEAGHELALQYNDISPLENMHCAKLYSIMSNSETNVFGKFSKEQYKEARKMTLDSILHTDMVLHNHMVKELQMLYEMNSDALDTRDECLASLAISDVLSSSEHKTLAANCILHAADVSNPCRSWEVTEAWAFKCLEEFFTQGDKEKALGLPVQFLNDRDKLNRPNSQIGFIEFMIAPLIAAQIRLWPSLRQYGGNLADNLDHWEEIWAAESRPSEEERCKVRERCTKVRKSLTERGEHRDGSKS